MTPILIARTSQERELDRLTVGERVVALDGVILIPGTVASVSDDFQYRDYTAPLGYRITRDGYEHIDAEPQFYSRDQLYRQDVERAELIERLHHLKSMIDYHIEELRKDASAAVQA